MSISFSFFAERFAAYRAPASLLVKCVLPCAVGPASESKQTPAFGFSRASRGIAPTRGVRTALVNLVGLLGLIGFAGLTGFAAFPSSPALAADLSTLPSCQADLTDRIGPQALPSLREVAPDGSSPESLTPLRTKRSGEIVLYVDSRMPEAVLLTLARSAERLGATVAVTGLPVKPRETNPAFRKEALETSDVLNAEGVLPRDRFELGNLAALVRAGLNVSVNPLFPGKPSNEASTQTAPPKTAFLFRCPRSWRFSATPSKSCRERSIPSTGPHASRNARATAG